MLKEICVLNYDLEKDLTEAIEKALQGTGVKPSFVLHHIEPVIEKHTADRDAWRHALQSLTPGGSEFTKPHECSNFVRDRNKWQWETIKRQKQERDELNKIAIENKLIVEQFQKLLGVYTTTDALTKVVELMQPELTQKQETPKSK
jgi:hypothetical protein